MLANLLEQAAAFQMKRLDFEIQDVFFRRHHGFIAGLAVEHLHPKRDDLREVLGVTFLVFVLVRLEPSFHVHQAALFQVLLANLPQPAPGLDVYPLGIFLVLAAGFPAVGYSNAEMSDLFASGCVLALGILTQIAD